MAEQVEGGATSSNDKSQDEKTDTADAYIFVLFDGTNNNKYNIREYRQWQKIGLDEESLKELFKKRKSGQIEYSNVARLSNICKTDESSPSLKVSYIYVDGIGTSIQSDSTGGQAVGTGNLGVDAKVQKGCELVVERLNDMFRSCDKPYDVTLHLAVTGFSRGAAAARRFVSCLEKNQGQKSAYNVCLQSHMDKLNSALTLKETEVPILGLYDTVSSYGISKTLMSSAKLPKILLKALANNVKELSLNKLENAKKVVQLCAADEYRLHFALTKVKDGGNSKNYIIPGCHSDVGGGILDNEVEEYRMNCIKKHLTFIKLGNGNKTRNELLDEGWFTEKEMGAGARVVSNKYSFIPFKYMLEKALKANLSSVKSKLFDDTKRRTLKYGEEAWRNDRKMKKEDRAILDKFRNYVMGETNLYQFPKISEYKLNQADIKKLRHRFIHLSATFSLVNAASTSNERVIVDG